MPHDTVQLPETPLEAPGRGLAQALLSSPPPQVSDRLAMAVAHQEFGLHGPLTRLSGERDSNFLCAGEAGHRRVLKFINPLESRIETDFQIEVLRHLARRDGQGLWSQHVPALSGADSVEVIDDAGRRCRVRAYTYLEGVAATEVLATPRSVVPWVGRWPGLTKP